MEVFICQGFSYHPLVKPGVYVKPKGRQIEKPESATAFRFLVTRRGLEPRTHCLKGSCSTGWANGSYYGWDGRIRTYECQSQSLVPYRLATSQCLARRPVVGHTKYYTTGYLIWQSLFSEICLRNQWFFIVKRTSLKSASLCWHCPASWIGHVLKTYNIKNSIFSDGVLCWHYLSSRAVTRQVLSAHMSLTSVFGMGTGGPSWQSIPTYVDGSSPSLYVKCRGI